MSVSGVLHWGKRHIVLFTVSMEAPALPACLWPGGSEIMTVSPDKERWLLDSCVSSTSCLIQTQSWRIQQACKCDICMFMCLSFRSLRANTRQIWIISYFQHLTVTDGKLDILFSRRRSSRPACRVSDSAAAAARWLTKKKLRDEEVYLSPAVTFCRGTAVTETRKSMQMHVEVTKTCFQDNKILHAS